MSFKLKLMGWEQVLTIIFGISGFMSIFVFLINRQIDMVNKRIDSVEKRLESIEKRMERMESRLDRIEEILLKALSMESKK